MKTLFLKIFTALIMLIVLEVAAAQAQTSLTALTNTAKYGPILTLGAHARVFTAPKSSFYNGTAIFIYNRTLTAAFIDTIVFVDTSAVSVRCDSTCSISINRESGQWLVPSGTATYTAKYPTITWLANSNKNGAKYNILSISFPAADTLVSKLVIKKPYL